MNDAKLEVKVDGGDLTLIRAFHAPRELVFQAYSSCEHLKNWWGPRMWPMVECSLDFRVGGAWHYCLRGPNEGDASWGKAVYEEIVAPERLAYWDYFSDEEGNINTDLPAVLSKIEFAESGGMTVLTMRAQYPSPAELQTVLDMGMIPGISETLDRLEEYLIAVNDTKA